MLKKVLLAIVAASGMFFVCGAAEDVEIKDITVSVALADAPEVDYKSHRVFSPKVASENKWLMIRVEYTPARERSSIYATSARTKKVSVPAWIDDVQLEVKVLMETGLWPEGKKYVLFTGKTLFWSIKQDGNKHLALMFIPAKILDRYFVSAIGGKLGTRNFKAVAEMSAAGKLLGRGFCDISGSSPVAKMRNFERLTAKCVKLENSVISLARSPWALLAPDNFDVEKEIR